jgi:amino-acid N-acetyltransferase
MCSAQEPEARAVGVETLYLLTTAASGLFADRGYAAIERGRVPDDTGDE